MTSERQRAANQANALHSTGPKTPEGKAAVRFNAFRHGLLARDAVLPGEDADAFEDLWNQVRAKCSPVGPIEEFLAERVVNTMWRLRRLARAETALLYSRVHELKASRLENEVRSYEKTVIEGIPVRDGFSVSTEITDEASYTEAVEALEQAKAERDRDEVLLACVLSSDRNDTLDKLARYERSLERSLDRALKELREEQDRRRNRPSPRISDVVTLNSEDTERCVERMEYSWPDDDKIDRG
jgi:hypothetical protein